MSIIDTMTSNDPATQTVMTAVRDLAKIGGMVLVSNGVATSSQVSEWSGIVVTAAAILWSLYVSYRKNKKIAVATTAVNHLSGGDDSVAAAAMNRAALSLSNK